MNPRKPRFYHAEPLNLNTVIELNLDASQHITRVLRMTVGEKIILFNNPDGEYTGVIESLKPKTQVTISEYHSVNRESPLKLHLAQGLARNDKMDFIIQKATELGVSSITPLTTARSIVKLHDKQLQKKMDHWSSIIISAAQQCGRTHLPVLNAPLSLQNFVQQSFEGFNIYFDPTATASLKTLNAHAQPHAIRMLIGPESGFTEEELNCALKHQFQAYTLGPRILRTETAGIAALCALQTLYGDLA